jgi:arginyl-tRNA synthetase
LWNKGNDNPELRFIVADDPARTAARLALLRCVALTIASGLALMGVEPVDEMR